MKTKYTDCHIINVDNPRSAEANIKAWMLSGYVPQGSLQLVLNSRDAPSYVILMVKDGVKETNNEPN